MFYISNVMKNLFKGKLSTVIILLATFVLAGVAIFTAVRLYQLRQVPVAPNVPESAPQAAVDVQPLCSLRFTITPPSPTPTPSKSPSPTPSASPTPVPLCNTACTTSAQCPSGLTCSAGFCRNPQCTTKADCVCSTATPTPTATPTHSPTPTPSSSPSPSPTPSASPTPVPYCNTACTTTSQCPSGMTCSGGFCRNTSCTSQSNCVCATATPTPTPSASPTPVPQCNYSCTSNADCPNNLFCSIASGDSAGNCRNATCTGESSCVCATATPTITATPGPTQIAYGPTPTPPSLPQSGTDWTTYFGIGIGILTIIGSLILAF